MYTLYYSPGACSAAIHVLLNELNVPYEAKKVTLRPEKSPELLKVNPAGQVPVLTLEDGYNLLEGGAILTYLCDTHGQCLPKDGTARAKALQALMFCNSTLHPAYSKLFMFMGMGKAEGEVYENCVQQVQKLWDRVEEQLAATKYLAGNEFTVGDILLTVIANWQPTQKPFTFGPNTQRLLKEVSSRPAYQKTLTDEGTQYKAAA